MEESRITLNFATTMNTYGQHIRQEDGRDELYPFDYIEYYEAKVKPRNTYTDDHGEEKTLYDGLTSYALQQARNGL